MSGPFFYMAVVNVAAGLFSGLAGLKKAIAEKAPWPVGEQATTANPWMYVIGGGLTALVGVGNYYQLTIASLGTVVFICTSVYDGWFGAGSKDWRFITLNLFVVVQTSLLIWSTFVKSPFSLP